LLGPHIEQRGSSITESSLRFDFSHFSGLTPDEIASIELEVNKKIWANLPVSTKIMSLNEAKHSGAIALFDEKYAEKVRVVSMGDFSMELCGGTHVNSTGEIGGFKILSEAAIASGVRRIEACTAQQAFIYNQSIDKKLKTIAALFKTGINEILPKIQQILDVNKAQEKELLQLKNQAAINDCGRLLSEVVNVDEIKVLVAKLENIDAKILRNMLDQLLQQLDSAVILLATIINDKIQLVVGVNKDCSAQFSAKELAQYVAAQIGGSAGGKSDIAQGGGTEIAKLDAALDSVLDWIKVK
jgi:alanyl-tRNA synthetase